MDTLASEKQVAFLMSLVKERNYPSDEVARITSQIDGNSLSKSDASRYIAELLNASKKAPAKAGGIDLPAGHYAVSYEGALRFYKIVDGKGRWDGYRFLNRYSSDNFVTRIPSAERSAVLSAISADIDSARRDFAVETVRCWRCGRRLTDEASRLAGIGPDCAKM